MTRRLHLALWLFAACISVAVLGLALRYSSPASPAVLGAAISPRPAVGRLLFQQKGCSSCHGSDPGNSSAPPLHQRASLTSLPKLVVALWNHAPHMWAAMEQRGLPYPNLSYEETSQLISYLYLSGMDDSSGDPRLGAQFWQKSSCARCHGSGAEDARIAAALQGDTFDWTQALWNHAAGMSSKLNAARLDWPRFGPNDLRDLLAFLRQQAGQSAPPDTFVAGDPDRGWQAFQQRGCIGCHSLSADHASLGPYLGQLQKLPPTFSQFGAALLNHIPQMESAAARKGVAWPTFGPHEVRDITVFFYSLRYLEPSGSPQIGRTVFSWRGCANCHGASAEGGAAPRLRGKGTVFTAPRLATDLWRHGRLMQQRAQHGGQNWPQLQDSDVGDLIAFLNSST